MLYHAITFAFLFFSFLATLNCYSTLLKSFASLYTFWTSHWWRRKGHLCVVFCKLKSLYERPLNLRSRSRSRAQNSALESDREDQIFSHQILQKNILILLVRIAFNISIHYSNILQKNMRRVSKTKLFCKKKYTGGHQKSAFALARSSAGELVKFA